MYQHLEASLMLSVRSHDRRTLSLFVSLITGVLCMVGINAKASESDADPRTVLKVIATGYRSNRDAFDRMDCRFERVRCKASSLQLAENQSFDEKSASQEGHWLVNHDFVKYDLVCEKTVTERVTKKMEDSSLRTASGEGALLVIECSDMHYLRHIGRYSLSYGPLNLTANLFTADDRDPSGIRITPFSMDVMGSNEFSNPEMYISDSLSGRSTEQGAWTYRVVGVENSNAGRPMIVCEVGPGGRVRMGFDPERGFMLVMMSDRDLDHPGRRFYIAHVLEAKQCRNGAWFPMRTATIWLPDDAGPLAVDTIAVTHLDVDREVPLDEFALDVLPDVQVNRVNYSEWVNLARAEKIGVMDLERLHERCVQHGAEMMERSAEQTRLLMSAPPPALEMPTHIVWLSVVNLVVCVVAAILLVLWRRTRR